MNSFDKSMRLKGKVEEDRYFAKLDRDRLAALHAHQKGSLTAVVPLNSRTDKPVSQFPNTDKQADRS